MPLFDYICDDCGHEQEHFLFSIETHLWCPGCRSEKYDRKLAVIISNVEYGNPQENFERKIKPHIDSAYESIGRETLDGDSKTAENIFGTDRVKNTFSGSDE